MLLAAFSSSVRNIQLDQTIQINTQTGWVKLYAAFFAHSKFNK
jgi:hypothetical protein